MARITISTRCSGCPAPHNDGFRAPRGFRDDADTSPVMMYICDRCERDLQALAKRSPAEQLHTRRVLHNYLHRVQARLTC